MTESTRWRAPLTVLLLLVVVLATLRAPTLTRHAAEAGIAVWWNHLVPILLPGYVMAQALLALWPIGSGWVYASLAFLTFPPLTAVVFSDRVRSEGHGVSQWFPLLLYTNFYNPLLWPHPGAALRVDAALLTAALILAPPWRLRHLPSPVFPIQPRQWVLDGMNWTTIFGMAVVGAWIVHQWWPAVGLGWLIDPVAMHWQGLHGPSAVQVFWMGLGGLAWWIPVLLRLTETAQQALTLFLGRVAQALLATIIWVAAAHVIR